MNDKKYYHGSRNGTQFFADKSDFSTGVDVYKPKNMLMDEFLKDVAEMSTQHCFFIWPSLNGFSGYDMIEYRIHET